MGKCEKNQQRLLDKLNICKEEAKNLLLSNFLFLDENKLGIKNGTIVPLGSENEFEKCNEIIEFYEKNHTNFVFKLSDESIFTVYIVTDNLGNEVNFSYTFCSCPVLKDTMIDNIKKELKYPQDVEENPLSPFDIDLYNYFYDSKKSEKLITNLIDLAKNPIYIRCDYDSKNASAIHPEYHLTLNFISDSRFKIDKKFSFKDFVVFILDSVYGIKTETSSQYIHLDLHSQLN